MRASVLIREAKKMRRISKRAAFWLYVMAVLLLSVCLVIIMPKFGAALVLC